MDDEHNRQGEPLLPRDAARELQARQRMKGFPYELDEDRRQIVLEAVVELCTRRCWTLHAVHVRTRHLHFVVAAHVLPERILRDAKVAATRRLESFRMDKPGTRRWAHHGSTRYLWKTMDVAIAVEYVLYRQGAPMAVWKPSEPRP